MFAIFSFWNSLSARARAGYGACLVASVVLLAYAPAIRGSFISDDVLLITNNPLVTGIDGLPSIWASSRAIDYTPLTLTVFWLEWRLWDGNPIGFHLVNILLHTGSVFLLWRILEKLSVPGALLGALLFAVHPVNAASVAWIAEGKNTISLLFYLLAVHWYLDFQALGGRRLYALALFAAGCAYLSKGSTVVLPLVLLLCIWWKRRRLGFRDWVDVSPFFVLGGVMALVTIHFQARIVAPELAEASIPFRMIRAGDAVWFYLWKDAVPLNLCAIYPMWPIDVRSPVSYLPALLVVALVFTFWLCRKKWGGIPFFVTSYFLLALLPALGFLSMGFLDQAYVTDWWQQIALIAPTALAGACVAHFSSRLRRSARPAIFAVAAAVLFLCSAGTWSEAAGYRSNEVFWTRVLARNPRSWGAHDNLGNVLQAQGKLEEAIAHFREAARINPDSAATFLNLGNTLRMQGRTELAIANYEAALRLEPDTAEIHNNLGVALREDGKIDEAIAQYRQALSLDPDSAKAHGNLGLILQTEGKLDEAETEYQEALRLDPNDAITHFNLGNAFQSQGRLDDAISQFQQALLENPDYAEAHNNLGDALQAKGRIDEALAQYQTALRLKPDGTLTCMNIGSILQAKGRTEEAIDYFQKAVMLEPNMDQAQWRLGSALLDANRVGEAMPHLDLAVRMNTNGLEALLELTALLENHHLYRESASHYRQGLTERPGEPELLNNLAWLLATCPDGAVRNGPEAVKLATQANGATGGKNPAVLSTLAAAYAEAGRFTEANSTAQTALGLASPNDDVSKSLKAAIPFFLRQQAYRQP